MEDSDNLAASGLDQAPERSVFRVGPGDLIAVIGELGPSHLHRFAMDRVAVSAMISLSSLKRVSASYKLCGNLVY